MLGPFLNDAIARSMTEGAKGGFGFVGAACNSCESRKLEIEADVVALRLLAHAGIDPRFALTFWEGRLGKEDEDGQGQAGLGMVEPPHSKHLHLHSEAKKGGEGGCASQFLRTHPVDGERVERIRDEIGKWLAYQGV